MLSRCALLFNVIVVQLPPEQAEGLPEGSRGLSGSPRRSEAKAGAIPPDRRREIPIDPAGVADPWHPSGMRGPIVALPEVSATLRPPATLCQPSGLGVLDECHPIDEPLLNLQSFPVEQLIADELENQS